MKYRIVLLKSPNVRTRYHKYGRTCVSRYGSTKVRSFVENSCSILISFKIAVIFNTTSAEIKTKSTDVILKITTILKEMRIAQPCSKSERTLDRNPGASTLIGPTW